jgi:hypothetical protein
MSVVAWDITFSDATEKDCSQILAIANEAFMTDAFFKNPEFITRFSYKDIESLYSSENSRFLVAKTSSGEIAGCIHVCFKTLDSIPVSQVS